MSPRVSLPLRTDAVARSKWVLLSVACLLYFLFFVLSMTPNSQIGTYWRSEGLPPLSKDSTTIKDTQSDKVAVIVVPRIAHRLAAAVLNVLSILPPEWKTQIFHSPEITDYVTGLRSLWRYFQSGQLSFHPTVNYSMTYSEFDALLKTASFWNQVEGEHVLIFQLDSVLCSNSPFSISDFLAYDWVGAPWEGSPHLTGNGGLSLRRKSKLLETISKCPIDRHWLEDKWFALCFDYLAEQQNFTINLPPRDVSMTFAVETLYWPYPFAVHKPWPHLPWHEMKKLLEFCPDIQSAMDWHPLLPWQSFAQ